jgi:hypothetical protein
VLPDRCLKSDPAAPFLTDEAVRHEQPRTSGVVDRSDDRPTEPSATLPISLVPLIPRPAAVPFFPKEWVDLIDERQGDNEVSRVAVRGSFAPAPVLRQSYSTLVDRVRRFRVPA